MKQLEGASYKANNVFHIGNIFYLLLLLVLNFQGDSNTNFFNHKECYLVMNTVMFPRVAKSAWFYAPYVGVSGTSVVFCLVTVSDSFSRTALPSP